ncbi:MAG: metalloregulator ArsR/SmtB family transcription factor [Chthoniobacteraceae bacterium]
MPKPARRNPTELIQIYQCFCDETRLRIINLLRQGPLCVCHFQELLDQPQVKISKHLAYLKGKGVVECERRQNWMIYSLPAKPGHELSANLGCLQDCTSTMPVFKQDLQRRRAITAKLAWLDEPDDCCTEPPAPGGRTRGPVSRER